MSYFPIEIEILEANSNDFGRKKIIQHHQLPVGIAFRVLRTNVEGTVLKFLIKEDGPDNDFFYFLQGTGCALFQVCKDGLPGVLVKNLINDKESRFLSLDLAEEHLDIEAIDYYDD